MQIVNWYVNKTYMLIFWSKNGYENVKLFSVI